MDDKCPHGKAGGPPVEYQHQDFAVLEAPGVRPAFSQIRQGGEISRRRRAGVSREYVKEIHKRVACHRQSNKKEVKPMTKKEMQERLEKLEAAFEDLDER